MSVRYRLVVAIICVCICGCATPDAVRDFTKSARDVTAQFAPFAEDIGNSCVRRKMAEEKPTEITNISAAAKAACKQDFDLRPDLLGAMNVLSEYLNALNRLASNEIVSFDKQTDAFATKLQASTSLPAPATNAVKGLAKFLADAAASGYQRKKLAVAVRAADASVTALTDALGHIVGIEYVRDLRNEQESLQLRYEDAMRSAGKNDALALLLQRQWRRDLEILNKRIAAAKSYQAALEKVRDGHHQLAAHSTQLSARELARELEQYTDSLQGVVSSISAAFN